MNAAGPTGGVLLRPSDKTHPKTIVFVQCVGSRCADGRGKSYCSKICCMYTAKHAMLCREKYPDTDVYVFYIDVRTPGKNFDEFYRRAVEEYGDKAENIQKTVRDIDKQRARYCQHYCDQAWEDADNYDLCLNSGKLGVDHCVDVIRDTYQMMKAE